VPAVHMHTEALAGRGETCRWMSAAAGASGDRVLAGSILVASSSDTPDFLVTCQRGCHEDATGMLGGNCSRGNSAIGSFKKYTTVGIRLNQSGFGSIVKPISDSVKKSIRFANLNPNWFHCKTENGFDNDTDVAHYNFNAHQPILVIFWHRCC